MTRNSHRQTITLTTDFGLENTYAAQMKGVIARICPDTCVVDATHQVPRHDIVAGTIALESIVDAFADGAIHVAVVDPGVGSARRAIAVATERFTIVAPDNGIATAALQHTPVCTAVELTNRDFHRPGISHTFHARDVFAPVAAHLVNDVAIDQLGPRIEDVHTLDLPAPAISDERIRGHVLCSDHFGNVITNVTIDQYRLWLACAAPGDVSILGGGMTIRGVVNTFSDVPRGQPAAYIGSTGRLEIALREGNAVKSLGLDRNTTIELVKQ